jgi:tight adherence protein B
VTRDGTLAALAGALAVVVAWDVLVVIEREGAPALRRVLAPLAPLAHGRDLTLGERRRLAVVGALVLLAGGWLMAGPLAALAFAAGAPALARMAVAARRWRWSAELARSAPALARTLADALAAGHSIRGALGEAAPRGGLSRAAAAELADAGRSLALGEPTEVVLERLRSRAATPAFDTLIAAILLQREAGGNLAGLLRDMAAGLEEAERLTADARAVTAQARFTGALVAGLPLAAAALAELAAPGYLRDLTRAPLPAALATLAAVLQVVGFVLIRSLARVRS